MSSVIDAGPASAPTSSTSTTRSAFAAERELFEHIRSGDERPFCFVVSFTHPHDPYAIPQEWWDLYRDEDMPMPVHGYDASISTPHERRLRAVCAMDDVEISDDQVRAARRAYYGAVSYVDDHIARLVEIAARDGPARRTPS